MIAGVARRYAAAGSQAAGLGRIRGGFRLHSFLIRGFRTQSILRNSVPKLEKPSRYTAPSHPTTTATGPTGATGTGGRYGGSLSEKELAAQQVKQYPNMMPTEGTFLHWFLTNRQIHVWISMSVLISLAIFSSIQSLSHWRETNEVARAAQLPPAFDLIWRPYPTWKLYVQAWRMYKIDESNKIGEQRQRNVNDTDHHRAYRKAHGIDEGFLRGLVAGDEPAPVPPSNLPASSLDQASTVSGLPELTEQVFVPPPKKPVKRWLGIWE